MKAVRFLHTADWQMGMRAAHVGAAGARVRTARLEASRRVAEIAREREAQFILVAGDTFENNAIDRVLVQQTADALAAAGVPVFLIPGNHDPLMPGSVWEHPAWSPERNLHVLREVSPIPLPTGSSVKATLYPCPVLAKHSTEDPTCWIPVKESTEDGIRIGLAHGTVQGAPVDAEPDYPIARDAAQRAGLDYLALGHWHSYASYPGRDGATRMAYSGTHETTKFGERDSGNVLLVEIAEPGAPPTLTSIRTGGLDWKVLQPIVNAPGDLARVLAAVEGIDSPESTLLDVRLSGLFDPAEAALLDQIRTVAAARFLYGRMDDSQLYSAPDLQETAWLEELPPGIARGVAVRLAELAAGQESAAETDDGKGTIVEEGHMPDPAVAARALRELYLLVREGSGS